MANVSDKSILTAAGKALLAQLNAEEKALVIDKMIFANVPNRPEYPQPDDVVPTDNVVHQAAVEQRGRLSEDSVIYSTTLASNEGPFEFNWTGAYCSEYGVLVTIDHHSLTPKTVDEPGVSGNTLVRSVVLEYKDIAEITNITVDASTWQYNATPRMKKMDNDVAQANIDQNGKDWFIEEGFLVTPQASAFSIKAGAGYVSGNRVALEFDRSIQVPNKPSFIYIDAHREGTPTGEQVTLFNFVVSAEEKDDYIDSSTGKDVPHFVCKIAQVLVDGSVSDLRPESEVASVVQVGSMNGKSQEQIANVAIWPAAPNIDAKIQDVIEYASTSLRISGKLYTVDKEIPSGSIITTINEQGKTVTISGVQYKLGGSIDMSMVLAAGSTFARPMSEHLADVINVRNFGITGEVNVSDFRVVQNYITNFKLKNVRLVFPEKLTIVGGGGAAFTLDGLESLVVDGLSILDKTTYRDNFTFIRMFDLINCKTVSLTNMDALSTLESVEPDGEKKGFSFVRVDGCDMLTYKGKIEKGYRAFEAWNTKVVNADSFAKDCRYNAVAQEGCGILNFNLIGERCRRDYYIYGCSGANVIVDSIDPYGHSPMVLNVENNDEQKSLSNVHVSIKIRNERKTYSLDTRQAPVTLTFRTMNDAVGKAIARNITFQYDVVGEMYGSVIDLCKYKSATAGDDKSRGYLIDGLKLKGRFESKLMNHTRLFNYDTAVNWHSGDYIQKVDVERLTVITSDDHNFSLNLDFIAQAVHEDGNLMFNGLAAPNGVIKSDLEVGVEVKFLNTKLRDYTTKDAVAEGRSTLAKKDWAIIPSGVTEIDFASVDNERSINMINIEFTAHSDPEALNSAVLGVIAGYVSFNASGEPSVRTETTKFYENSSGTLVNPVIKADALGKLSIDFPEYSGSDIKVWLDANLNYTQYTNITNKYLVGLVSKQFSFTFGAK
ncbi:phage tail protein [Vibrio cyclitrophicus]